MQLNPQKKRLITQTLSFDEASAKSYCGAEIENPMLTMRGRGLEAS